MSLALSNLLLAQHNAGTLIETLDENLVPKDRAEAYVVQSEVVASLGPIGAWKVQPYPTDAEPLASPIPASFVFPAGDSIALNTKAALLVEAEVAVTLKSDLPAFDGTYGPADVLAAIGTTQLAIEILAPRFANPAATPSLAGIADLQSNGAVIFGASRSFDDLAELGTLEMALLVDGASIGKVTEGPTTERTLRSLAWLANHAVSRGTPLKAGDVIITGARIGALPLNGKAITITAPGFETITATLV
ncbi:fumarylacetoacetate hydrolase family protein [Devosia sp. MC532]|uniref:fumarylacetoacetate hydrolase family protein n=1 Tax=Devosia sp. MC532 TaxID=2799788 RepID=UPI0018F6061A|nr:fumarylacetoacetate hydrolase family protein [Devosia sp. MC532]MBJ7578255.1 fumarylacetoacetate hydrolase family protein [Devosia sp. MC532]